MNSSANKGILYQLKELMLAAPDNQLDSQLQPLVHKWNEVPTAIQILEVVDQCIHADLSSGLVLLALQIGYKEALALEGTTNEEVAKLATWRT